MKGLTADGTYFIDWSNRETNHPVILTYGWVFGSRNRVVCNGVNVSHLPIRRIRTGEDGYVVYGREAAGKYLFGPDGSMMEVTMPGKVEYYLLEKEDVKVNQRRKDERRADL